MSYVKLFGDITSSSKYLQLQINKIDYWFYQILVTQASKDYLYGELRFCQILENMYGLLVTQIKK